MFFYGMSQRPLAIGAIPAGHGAHFESDVWRHGVIAYEQPLTEDQVKQYELVDLNLTGLKSGDWVAYRPHPSEAAKGQVGIVGIFVEATENQFTAQPVAHIRVMGSKSDGFAGTVRRFRPEDGSVMRIDTTGLDVSEIAPQPHKLGNYIGPDKTDNAPDEYFVGHLMIVDNVDDIGVKTLSTVSLDESFQGMMSKDALDDIKVKVA